MEGPILARVVIVSKAIHKPRDHVFCAELADRMFTEDRMFTDIISDFFFFFFLQKAIYLKDETT